MCALAPPRRLRRVAPAVVAVDRSRCIMYDLLVAPYSMGIFLHVGLSGSASGSTRNQSSNRAHPAHSVQGPQGASCVSSKFQASSDLPSTGESTRFSQRTEITIPPSSSSTPRRRPSPPPEGGARALSLPYLPLCCAAFVKPKIETRAPGCHPA